MYRERAARPAGAVVWTRTVGPGPQRILPDGCTDLIWCDTGSGGELIVAGPDTVAQLAEVPQGTRCTGLRFAPGTGPAVFGVPADELRDLRVPLDALWPAAEVRGIVGALERMTEGRSPVSTAGSPDSAAVSPGDTAGDPGSAVGGPDSPSGAPGSAPGGVLEAVALARLRAAPPADPLIPQVVTALTRGARVAAIAARAGLSERQLHRRSLAAFGYGPKTLARVLRLNRALDAVRAGVPYAQVAAAIGYADQAHLAREVRALTGVPLSTLIDRPGQADAPRPGQAGAPRPGQAGAPYLGRGGEAGLRGGG